MPRRTSLWLLAFTFTLFALADSTNSPKPKSNVPPVVHSQIGDKSAGVENSLQIENIGKRQQYSAASKATFDKDISSPKSATFSKDGNILYVNSLEGCKTVAYQIPSLEKKYVVNYNFPSATGSLWAQPSGYYPFTHYANGTSRAFSGKPVESTWSHAQRYLWVPFYRRTFDINAQDPSAVAVIDADKGEIIRMFETGPLPKAIATSPDNSLIAITHWGDNTIGFIDISSPDINKWHHLPPITVGHKLQLNYSMTTPVNRDSNSGYLLRGTVFTPDGEYLLVAGLAGPLAVINIKSHKLVGMVQEIYGLRHLAIHGNTIYGTRNVAGEALSFPLDGLLQGVKAKEAGENNSIKINGNVKRVKVGGGARTLEVAPDGKYIFIACNSGNAVYVVETESMKVVDKIRCDSYPVGLAISPDGKYMAVTSQGRKGFGGNALNLFQITRFDLPITQEKDDSIASPQKVSNTPLHDFTNNIHNKKSYPLKTLAFVATGAVIIAVGAFFIVKKFHKS